MKISLTQPVWFMMPCYRALFLMFQSVLLSLLLISQIQDNQQIHVFYKIRIQNSLCQRSKKLVLTVCLSVCQSLLLIIARQSLYLFVHLQFRGFIINEAVTIDKPNPNRSDEFSILFSNKAIVTRQSKILNVFFSSQVAQ